MDEADHRRFISSGSAWEAMAGYSRAVVDGDWIFVSGTLGQDFSTMRFPASAQAQAEKALDTIEAALGSLGWSALPVPKLETLPAQLREDLAAVAERHGLETLPCLELISVCASRRLEVRFPQAITARP